MADNAPGDRPSPHLEKGHNARRPETPRGRGVGRTPNRFPQAFGEPSMPAEHQRARPPRTPLTRQVVVFGRERRGPRPPLRYSGRGPRPPLRYCGSLLRNAQRSASRQPSVRHRASRTTPLTRQVVVFGRERREPRLPLRYSGRGPRLPVRYFVSPCRNTQRSASAQASERYRTSATRATTQTTEATTPLARQVVVFGRWGPRVSLHRRGPNGVSEGAPLLDSPLSLAPGGARKCPDSAQDGCMEPTAAILPGATKPTAPC